MTTRGIVAGGLTGSGGSSLVGFLQSGTGAVARTAQSKMRDIVNLTDFGADPTGVASCTAAITAAGSTATNVEVNITAGVWNIATAPTPTGKVTYIVHAGASFTGAQAAYLTAASGPNYQVIQIGSAGTDFASSYVRRNATHSSGTAGVTAGGLRVDTYVSAGVVNYEWSITGVVYNSATGGQNVGGYLLGNKMASNSGPTFGAVADIDETVAINDPTTSSVGIEVDVRSNGTDANNNRIAVDIYCGKYTPGGASTQVGYGCRIQTAGDTTGTRVKTGFGFQSGVQTDVAFDASASTVSQAAFKLATNQNIAFDAAATQLLGYDTGGIAYQVSSSKKLRLNTDGSISAAFASAIPAGGTANLGLMLSSTGSFGIFFGSGAPSLAAAKGSLYLRSDGSATNNRMYVNTDGNTTWTAVTTAA